MSSNKAAPETATAMPSQAPRLPAGFIVLSPVGEGWREGNKPQGLYFRRLRDLGEVAATWKVPSPRPSAAQGRERIAAG
ncbi:hypothetical protein ACES87_001855, partial [Neisseria gonorrhoeae]